MINQTYEFQQSAILICYYEIVQINNNNDINQNNLKSFITPLLKLKTNTQKPNKQIFKIYPQKQSQASIRNFQKR